MLRHFDEYSNSSLEGSNSGIKDAHLLLFLQWDYKSPWLFCPKQLKENKKNERLSSQDISKKTNYSCPKCSKHSISRGIFLLNKE